MIEETIDKTTEESDPGNDLKDVSPADEQHPEKEGTAGEHEHGSKKSKRQIRKLEEHIAELDAKLKAAEDQNLRLYAEFDNFRKRMARERIELLSMAGKDILESLLPVVDDLERAKQTIADASDATGAIKGFELITSKLMTLLEQRGLKAMESIGQPFDPDLHEAVSEVEVEDEAQKGVVVHEVVRGYRLNDRIIRHAKVVVGK